MICENMRNKQQHFRGGQGGQNWELIWSRGCLCFKIVYFLVFGSQLRAVMAATVGPGIYLADNTAIQPEGVLA